MKPEILALLMQSQYGRQYFQMVSAQVGIATISRHKLMDFPIPLLTLDVGRPWIVANTQGKVADVGYEQPDDDVPWPGAQVGWSETRCGQQREPIDRHPVLVRHERGRRRAPSTGHRIHRDHVGTVVCQATAERFVAWDCRIIARVASFRRGRLHVVGQRPARVRMGRSRRADRSAGSTAVSAAVESS